MESSIRFGTVPEAFFHMDLQGLALVEVARHMGRTVPAVAGLLHRGLRTLREELGETWKGDDR